MEEKEKRCFVIMPFGKYGTDEFQRNLKIYQIMIKPVVEEMGYQSIRADELENMGNITKDIIEHLHECDLVIADLSGRNANVFYELGVRHVLHRCGTINIICKGETLPFDIAPYRAIFYTSELDGPEQFRKELEKRIKAFEQLRDKKSDNPVHDILGNKLIQPILDNYVDRQTYDEKLNELEALKSELRLLKGQLVETQTESKETQKQLKLIQKGRDEALAQVEQLNKKIARLEIELQQAKNLIPAQETKPPKQKAAAPLFRSQPATLSEDDVKAMLKKYGFFDSRKNENGKGFKHQFEAKTIKGEKVVIDQASNLMWQQSGSANYMNYDAAKKYIDDLNKKKFAGYDDWRLPTLEEAMSLTEPRVNKNGLYIDPVFDATQFWIWTCDPVQGESRVAWVVFFGSGYCSWGSFVDDSYVRAVRSRQSSLE